MNINKAISIIDLFTKDFLLSFIVLIIIAIMLSALSPFLVLKKEALISDGISHACFLGFVINGIFGENKFYLAIITSIISSLLMKFLINKTKNETDSIIGIISSLFLAIGLMIISLSSGFNISIESLMQGSITFINDKLLYYLLPIFILVYLFIMIFFRKLILITFDYKSANLNLKYKVFLSYSLTLLTSLAIVISIKVLGAFLTTPLLIMPILVARNFKLNFKYTFLLGIVISIFVVFLSRVIAFMPGIPVSTMIVVIYFSILVITILINKLIKKRG